MRFHKSRTFLALLCTVIVTISLLPSSPVDAKGPRKRRILPCPNVCYSGPVCPMYSWMNFGYYCSYYSLIWDTCQPVSYDSSDCNLPHAYGCDTDHNGQPPAEQTNCQPTFKTLAGLKMKSGAALGRWGYGYNESDPTRSLPKVLRSEMPFGTSNNANLDIRGISYVIKFYNPVTKEPMFVQMFVADVSPKDRSEPDVYYPGLKLAHFARGTEIDDRNVIPDFDFSLQADALVFDPDYPHAFTFEYSGLQVPIITHWSTKSHDDN